MREVDVGDRWAPVADTWMAHVDDHLLAFNDLHCAFAAARSSDPEHVSRLSRSLDDYQRFGLRRQSAGYGRGRPAPHRWRARFCSGDYGRAVEAILPVRDESVRIGGSHAQRDIINLT